MRTVRHLILASVFYLGTVSASAQQTTSTSSPPATSDPQAVALVQKALTALTGGASISDVTLTGTAERIAGSDDETGTATLMATSAGDSKVALGFPSGDRTEIRNHSAVPLPGGFPALPPNLQVTPVAQATGSWSGPDGTKHPIANHNAMTDATWFFPALTLARIASSSYVLSYIGPESIEGQSALHISVSQQFPQLANSTDSATAGMSVSSLMQHLSQIDIYFDPRTALPLALAFNQHPDGNALTDIPVRIQFSNYANSGGMVVPLHVQKLLNNSLVLDLQFTNATFNSGLSSSSFQLQ
ncbi:MAG TPA: hypothetical protein VEJ38_01170 [Candidatus Acidoferrales bacterium]|nr:hypothetical protein [Candidatus Acidoferrales bacterium]